MVSMSYYNVATFISIQSFVFCFVFLPRSCFEDERERDLLLGDDGSPLSFQVLIMHWPVLDDSF